MSIFTDKGLILPCDLVSSRVIIDHVPECILIPTYAFNMTRPSHPGELVDVIVFSWQSRSWSFS